MATKELNLIRKAYCHKRKISDVNSVTFAIQRVNRITGNQVFLVSQPTTVPEIYEHLRLDVSVYTQQKSLSLPKDLQKNREAMLSKESIAGWINKQVNLELLPEDIGFLVLGTNQLTVVMGPNSMRFQGSFIIYFL